ncbi:hypothetical protein E2C01_088754 [Portunus trituberculatus]|uniref:Uncharacterized protein n=1 Tax=Portunus trituberculatus TaxID=210409 RepID=A0A5B7JA67_PORTR|nr:hypothetical protein [Portunus trituberculatus]
MLPRILIRGDERARERKCHLHTAFLGELADWWMKTANRVSFYILPRQAQSFPGEEPLLPVAL